MLQSSTKFKTFIREVVYSNKAPAILAVGLDDGTFLLHDSKGGTQRLRRSGDPIMYITFSPSDDLIACAARKSIYIWETKGLNLVNIFDYHKLNVVDVKFSPDGKTLASASHDGIICIWDMIKRSIYNSFYKIQDPQKLSFSSDGKLLAIIYRGGDIYILNFCKNIFEFFCSNEEKVYMEPYIEFSHTSNLVAVCNSGIIKLWDMEKKLKELKKDDFFYKTISFSQDDRLLAACSSDKTAAIWDVEKCIILKTFHNKYYTNCISFHPNGKQIACGLDNEELCVWTICEWDDKTHHLFFGEIRRIVFIMMCVRQRKIKEDTLKLQISVWLKIFSYLIS
jgi:WD40 repeat protein